MKNTGQIIRSRTIKEYVSIPNELARDGNLTNEERGMLIFLLSLPPDWVLYKANLYNHMKADGKHSVDRVFKNLQEKGYILSVRIHDGATGQYVGWNHIVYDQPAKKTEENQSPRTGLPKTGKAEVGKTGPIQSHSSTITIPLQKNILQRPPVEETGNPVSSTTPQEEFFESLENGGLSLIPAGTPSPAQIQHSVNVTPDVIEEYRRSFGRNLFLGPHSEQYLQVDNNRINSKRYRLNGEIGVRMFYELNQIPFPEYLGQYIGPYLANERLGRSFQDFRHLDNALRKYAEMERKAGY